MTTARELRQKYLRFFESKGHTIHPSGSLVPIDVTGRLDESLLFNGAGMVQFKPYFRGVAQPPNKRLTTAQKCVRTGDIETVGDISHLTFFEMLGNFSFGDYFKKEAVAFSWEFMTSPEWLGLDPARLSFTVFEDDDVAYEAWAGILREAGIDPQRRVFRLGEETNYWPAGAFSAGPPGPCGPNSEMFFWTREDVPPPSGPYTAEDWLRDDAAGNWLEIWNDVFIQYEWKGRLRNPSRPGEGYEKESIDPLPFESVDTGMGLERTAAVLNGFRSVYQTDLFAPILERINSMAVDHIQYGGSLNLNDHFEMGREGTFNLALSNSKYAVAVRVIADHIRTSCFCIADGVQPSNVGRGYVLRRLIRRAVLKGVQYIGLEQPFLHDLSASVLHVMGNHYTELIERSDLIKITLLNEEVLFRKTLIRGRTSLREVIRDIWIQALHEAVLFNDIPEKLPLSHAENQIWSQFMADAAHDNALFVSQFVDGHAEDYPNTVVARLVARWDHERVEPHKRALEVSGQVAFRLYDTFGFPLEVTKELAAEAGVEVDEEGFEEAMRQAQELSRGADNRESVYGGVGGETLMLSASSKAVPVTPFVGYDQTSAQTEIVQISPRFGADELTSGEFQVSLLESPFYAESGGQVGDTGRIVGLGRGNFHFEVQNTWKEMGLIWHDVLWLEGDKSPVGLNAEAIQQLMESGYFFAPVRAEVDADRRRSVTRAHSATHLLHAALRQTLGKHVTQAGSLVEPDRLRFDFTHGKAMEPAERAIVEDIVNRRMLEGLPVQIHSDMPLAEAKSRGAMALFGEKYGDRVRMVQMEDFSLELCGGCHVRQTSEIGLFVISHESSAASGVRRIEALTGQLAYDFVKEQRAKIEEASSILKSNPGELVHAVERTLEHAREEKKRREKVERQLMSGGSSGSSDVQTVGAFKLWTQLFEGVDPKIAASAVDDAVASNADLVAVVAVVVDEKVNFIAKAGASAVANGAHCGNLVREVAKIAGGGGGGRPDFATAGGKDPSKAGLALEAVAGLLG